MKSSHWAALASAVVLAALLASCGGSSPTPIPTPIITQMFPSNIVAGSDGFTLFVNGSLFISDSRGTTMILWNGSPLSTTLNQVTGELEATVPAANVLASGIAQVAAENPSPGGISLQSLTFTIVAPTPGLTLAANPLSPSSVNVGGNGFNLAVTGTGFQPNYVVTWNGSPRPTTISSATSATAQIFSADITSAFTASVAVATPGLLIATPSASFQVGSGADGNPAIASLAPGSASAGSGSFQMLITGSNFSRNAVVEWNGARIPTSYQNPSQLVATVPDSAVAMVGVANVDVVNPTPDSHGAPSVSVPFKIQ